jgi:hypothetical protein
LPCLGRRPAARDRCDARSDAGWLSGEPLVMHRAPLAVVEAHAARRRHDAGRARRRPAGGVQLGEHARGLPPPDARSSSAVTAANPRDGFLAAGASHQARREPMGRTAASQLLGRDADRAWLVRIERTHDSSSPSASRTSRASLSADVTQRLPARAPLRRRRGCTGRDAGRWRSAATPGTRQRPRCLRARCRE